MCLAAVTSMKEIGEKQEEEEGVTTLWQFYTRQMRQVLAKTRRFLSTEATAVKNITPVSQP